MKYLKLYTPCILILCKIKFSNDLSEPFISERGVKQGDVLSPLLFNFFKDDNNKNWKTTYMTQ